MEKNVVILLHHGRGDVIMSQKLIRNVRACFKNSKIIFWIIFILGALIACFSYIPMVDAAKNIFPAAASRDLTWFFPQRMNNSVMLWAAFNGIIGLLLFFLSYNFFGKKHGVSKNSWGLKADWKYIIKTFFLAVLVFSLYYFLLFWLCMHLFSLFSFSLIH